MKSDFQTIAEKMTANHGKWKIAERHPGIFGEVGGWGATWLMVEENQVNDYSVSVDSVYIS